jgi:hypothetical protein
MGQRGTWEMSGGPTTPPHNQGAQPSLGRAHHSFKNQTGSVVRPEKTWTDTLSGFLRVTGPTNKKLEKLHKNNVFLRGYDPKS